MPPDDKKCRCGCQGEAFYVVKGIDFDPKKPDKRGAPFEEPLCESSTRWVEENSEELGFPCSKERIP